MNKERHYGCNKYLNGLMQNSFLNSLIAVVESLEKLAEQWQEARGDWDNIKELMKSEMMIFYHSRFREVHVDLYYAQTIPVSNQLVLDLDKTVEFAEFYGGIMNYSYLALFLFFTVFLSVQFSRTMIQYYGLFYIFPLDILLSEHLIMVRLKKITKSKSFYKI